MNVGPRRIHPLRPSRGDTSSCTSNKGHAGRRTRNHVAKNYQDAVLVRRHAQPRQEYRTTRNDVCQKEIVVERTQGAMRADLKTGEQVPFGQSFQHSAVWRLLKRRVHLGCPKVAGSQCRTIVERDCYLTPRSRLFTQTFLRICVSKVTVYNNRLRLRSSM